LARSGEYTYSLHHRRESPTLDPVMDFLSNVKQGTCERYASGLALMLRSVGVPARVVKGFRGAQPHGEGNYSIRNSSAHAWVEALVRGRGSEELDWLLLDPTPDLESETNEQFSLARWLQTQQRSGEALWRELVVEFNASDQADLWARLVRQAARWSPYLGFLAATLAGLAWAGGRVRRRRTERLRGAPGLHARLVQILTRHTPLRLAPGQTPRELAEAAARELAPRLGPLAGVPAQVVEAFYRARYGGRPLAPQEVQ